MRTRLTTLTTGLVVGLALALAAVWANGFRAHLEDMVGHSAYSIDRSAPGTKHSAQVGWLCVRGGDSARITDVRTLNTYSDAGSGTFEITGFSLAPAQNMGTRKAQDLKTYLEKVDAPVGLSPAKMLLTRCDDADYSFNVSGLVVELEAPPESSLPVAISGFVVDYKVRGISKSITVPTGVSFCAEDERDKALIQIVEEHETAVVDEGNFDSVVYDCQP